MLFCKDQQIVVVYTNGNCINKTKGGIGIFYKLADHRNKSITYEDAAKALDIQIHMSLATNNRTELLAVLYAIKTNEIFLKKGNTLVIKTDSKYCIDALTKWYHGWLKNDWMNSTNKTILNRDLIEPIVYFIITYRNQISFKHLTDDIDPLKINKDDYNDIVGNDMAGKFAQLASFKSSGIVGL